jgi:hypothetical protein
LSVYAEVEPPARVEEAVLARRPLDPDPVEPPDEERPDLVAIEFPPGRLLVE